jgi:ubiquinone/menaquinone biosynthesis C-methylase UbiE
MVDAMASDQRYLPALGRLPLARLYDPLVALTSREGAFRRAVVAAAATPGAILDVGAGTGTLAVALADAVPDATITGLDGDPSILERARRKAEGRSNIFFVEGRAEDLPFDDASFDALTSTLVLHHLTTETKRRALREAARVVKPGGRVVVADWGRAADPLQAAAFLAIRVVDGFETTRDHAAGRLPELMSQAGLADVAVRQRWRTPVGTLVLICASVPH